MCMHSHTHSQTHTHSHTDTQTHAHTIVIVMLPLFIHACACMHSHTHTHTHNQSQREISRESTQCKTQAHTHQYQHSNGNRIFVLAWTCVGVCNDIRHERALRAKKDTLQQWAMLCEQYFGSVWGNSDVRLSQRHPSALSDSFNLSLCRELPRT